MDRALAAHTAPKLEAVASCAAQARRTSATCSVDCNCSLIVLAVGGEGRNVSILSAALMCSIRDIISEMALVDRVRSSHRPKVTPRFMRSSPARSAPCSFILLTPLAVGRCGAVVQDPGGADALVVFRRSSGRVHRLDEGAASVGILNQSSSIVPPLRFSVWAGTLDFLGPQLLVRCGCPCRRPPPHL